VCTGYRCGSELLASYPDRVDVLAGVDPVYETLPGWGVGVGDVRQAAQLPTRARRLIELIEEQVGVPVRVVGVGAERDDYLIWQ
jgi:adenylosuccinate synthase